MKQSASYLLSSVRLKYDGTELQGQTPEEIVTNLCALNKLRVWRPDLSPPDFEYTIYSPPEFIAGPTANPNTFLPKWAAAQQLDMSHYQAAVKTGNLALVHAVVDELDRVRSIMGGGEFDPVPDFEIVAECPTSLGITARALLSMRQENTDAVGDGGGTDPSWFDTKDAYDTLNAWAAQGW